MLLLDGMGAVDIYIVYNVMHETEPDPADWGVSNYFTI